MAVIYMSYHVIWQSKTDLVIWLVYDSHMTWVVIWTSYTCHITGSDMVSYRWYIQAYTSHMTSGTDESYESYMTVYVCHMKCCLRAGAPARSRIAHEMQRHTEFGLQGCLLCQCITQRVGATGQPSRRRWGKPPLQKTTQVATKSHRRRRQQW